MSWKPIQELLDTRLLALSGIDSTRILFHGLGLEPKQDWPLWYQADLLPAGLDPEMAGADHERGIYQVTVVGRSGRSGSGPGPLISAADAVGAHFRLQRLTSAGVVVHCGYPEPGPLLTDSLWIRIPVSIPFQSL